MGALGPVLAVLGAAIELLGAYLRRVKYTGGGRNSPRAQFAPANTGVRRSPDA